MGRLVNRSPALGICTLVWSLVTWGKIGCTRQWGMSRCAVCVHGGGVLIRTLRVHPSWRAEPGILLIWDRSWGIGSIVSVEDFSFQGHRRAECVGTGWKRYLRRQCACTTRCLVCVSNRKLVGDILLGTLQWNVGVGVLLPQQGQKCRARWCHRKVPYYAGRHLTTVCIARGLYLLWDCHGLCGDWVLPWLLRGCRFNTELWGWQNVGLVSAT